MQPDQSSLLKAFVAERQKVTVLRQVADTPGVPEETRLLVAALMTMKRHHPEVVIMQLPGAEPTFAPGSYFCARPMDSNDATFGGGWRPPEPYPS